MDGISMYRLTHYGRKNKEKQNNRLDGTTIASLYKSGAIGIGTARKLVYELKKTAR